MAIAACGATGALAQTGNPTAGGPLYMQLVPIAPGSPFMNSCRLCHGTNVEFRSGTALAGTTEAQLLAGINSNIMANNGGMGVYSFLSPTQRSDVAAYILFGPAPPPPPPLLLPPGTVPATPTATPSTVMFGSTPVGAKSELVSVLFVNTTGATITFANPAIASGTGNVGDFRNVAVPASVTACPTTGGTLGPFNACSFGAEFVPTAIGSRSATWTVNFTGGVVPSALTLQGTATAAVAGSSANAPLNAGAGALGWMNLLGLLALLGVSRTRRR